MRRRHGFTLVELLVTIAIISLLVAILLPVAQRFRRCAVVLNCPVVYLAGNSTLHLTGPGGHDLQVTDWYADWPLDENYQPVWSPSGRLVISPTNGGVLNPPDSAFYIQIVEPLASRTWLHPRAVQECFAGWADGNRYILSARADRNSPRVYMLRDADTGNVVQSHQPNNGSYDLDLLVAVPAASDAAYVAFAWHQEPRKQLASAIVLVRKDFSIRKIVWEDTNSNLFPRVDPTGEWVAWTHAVSDHCEIAIKSLKERSSSQPLFLPDPPDTYGGRIKFCDWTEDGQLLVNVMKPYQGNSMQEDWRLILMNRDGKVTREIATETPVMRYSLASWRKYGHR